MIVPMPCSRSTSGTKVMDRKPPAAAALRVNSGVSGAATSGISMIRRSRIARVEGERSRSNGIGYIVRTRLTSKPEIEAAVAFQCSLSSFRVVIVAEQGSNSFAALSDDRFEHRLHVRWRTGDDFQDFGGCRLLLAGFLQVFARTGDRTMLNPGGRRRSPALGLGGLEALCWACVADFRLARLAARS